MVDFGLHRPSRSSPLSGRPGGVSAVVEGGAGDLLTTARGGDGLTLGHHPLIRQLVNRTPPITSPVQIRSVALRITQCCQPSRMISIRLAVLFRRTASVPRVGCSIVSSGGASLSRAAASSSGSTSTIWVITVLLGRDGSRISVEILL